MGEHNTSKRGARYTKSRRPVTLVYSEKHKTKSMALKREIEIKKWPRKKKLTTINVSPGRFLKKRKII